MTSEVVSRDNASIGIFMGGLGAGLSQAVSVGNGSEGVDVAFFGGSIEGVVVEGNASTGIRGSDSLRIESVSASGNLGGGIDPGNGSVVSRVSIFGNTGAGISLGSNVVRVGQASISLNSLDEISSSSAGSGGLGLSNLIACNGYVVEFDNLYSEDAYNTGCLDF